MKRLILACMLLVAACANQTALDRVAILEQSFTTAETGLRAYARLSDCATAKKPCSETAVLVKARDADNKAFDAIQQYRNAVLAGQADTTLNELFTAANAAIAALSSIVPSQGAS